jgi:mannose-6-phosphate isomerase
MPPQQLYPFVFKPIFKQRVWGGRRLESNLGKALPPNNPIGESWELSDLPDPDQSEVAAGSLEGVTLGQLVEQDPQGLMGPVALDQGSFPLLVKYIDASQTLSIQVHPDETAAARLGGRPKSEAWYVLDADPEAVIYLGLHPGTGPEQLRRALETGGVEELVVRVPARPGTLLPVPPGTVHAIGAGILLAEVQQPSDTTYRVYDWGRVGLDGQPRQLHVDQALQSIHYDAAPRAEGGEAELGLFRVRELKGAADLEGEGPAVLVGLEGTASVVVEGTAPKNVGLGDVVLVPHASRQRRAALEAEGDARTLLVTFPAGSGSR